MRVTIGKPGSSFLLGFGSLSLVRVTGFNQDDPTEKCLTGPRDPRFGKTMPLGTHDIVRGRQTYFLAGTYGREGTKLGVAFFESPSESFVATTTNGYRFIFEGARRDTIPKVAPGYASLPDEFTQSPWWQYGVQIFGYQGLVFAGGHG